MSTSLLITPQQLQAALSNGSQVVVFDCSYELSDASAGKKAYLGEHIPGALFADIGEALSSHGGESASGGRHPLPTRAAFAQWLSARGVANDALVVVYDRNRGNFCVRLWWMLQWLGHDQVAVLDGGLQGWKATGAALASGEEPARAATPFEVRPALVRLVSADEVQASLGDAARVLIDARGADRFRGEHEPMDAIAGHIPGAINRPFSQNLRADGSFKPAEELRAEFEALLPQGRTEIVNYCGSGVSATPNIFALRLAGLGDSGLYAGSWSDWSRRPGAPVATGA